MRIKMGINNNGSQSQNKFETVDETSEYVQGTMHI